MWPAELNFQSLSGRRYSPTKSKKQEVADQELLKTVISVYRCSGFALATIVGCAVLFVTVLTLDALSSVSEQAGPKIGNFCFLEFVGLC